MGRQRFVQDMKAIETALGKMAQHARAMLEDGVQAFSELDRDRAQGVCDRRDALADQDEKLELDILHFLTLQSPVAGDLRRIGASLKLITYLNRVGRYGYDIARVALDWPDGRDHVAKTVGLREMAARVQAMLDLCLQAFQDGAAPDTDRLLELEDDVDAQRFAVWRECLTYMAEDPKHIEPCAHYMMVARYLERAGDNICKIGEKLHYAATGERTWIR